MIFFFLYGCATGSTPPPEVPLTAEPPPELLEPPIEEEEEPAVPPPPPPVTAPDGTVMAPCLVQEVEGMACVMGGAFKRGFEGSHSCDQYENKAQKTQYGPEEEIWLQTFYMDKTEVTYEAYQSCVADGDCPPAKPSYSDYNRPNQPMVGMSWYAAKAFCEAKGKRLPSEAQWEKAARGSEGSQTPFGQDVVGCEQAVVKDEKGRSCGVKKLKGSHPEKGRTWEVGLMSAGSYGIYDMVGNAEEWVSDWFSPSFDDCGENCQGTDPLGPCDGADKCAGHNLKMVKGGSWYWDASHATGWHRRPHVPSNKPYHHFGFRCGASLAEAQKITEKDNP